LAWPCVPKYHCDLYQLGWPRGTGYGRAHVENEISAATCRGWSCPMAITGWPSGGGSDSTERHRVASRFTHSLGARRSRATQSGR
jgi:hypothetical protein